MQILDAVALVTGASSGLGLATATSLARAGAHVVGLDLSPASDTSSDDAALRRIEFIHGDVTSPIDVQRAVEAATSLGALRIVVNCAGVADPGRTVGRGGPLALEAFERVIRINLLGTFNVVRLAAAAMQSEPALGEERGVIITTASVAAFDGQIGQAAYSASKGGVASMTLPLAREFAAHLIRVACIAPGIFETPMMAGLPADAQASLAAQVPHPSRLGRPHEYAALVQHIVENPMLNGETIRLDGAIRMGPR